MLLKDVIEIPEHLGSQDFVLRLTDGVTEEHAQATLDQYVITPEIAKRFGEALGILQSALGVSVGADGKLQDGQHQPGRAVYLHGSFGSGKSHFMAVLHLLLRGHTSTLGRPELAEVVAKHQPWLGQRKFLLVPYHMLGASALEERVFDGYCRTIRRAHPDATIPALFESDSLIANAESLRQKIGDDAFFRLLADDSADDGWGDLATTWTADAYSEAIAAPHGDPARQRLIAALVERVFPAYGGAQGTIPFDQGLELMTRHASELGYHGIVLFLDELILWLASRAAIPGFIEAEIDKLVNLVEAQALKRPIPIVSFIARQRDLRDLVDQTAITGAEQLLIDDKLTHHEGRFAKIELSTTDLPEIASKRLLKPKNAAAEQAIDSAFQAVVSGKDQLKRTLLGDTYTIDDFRKVYPFSPVLVDALVSAASMLQRDRTALRAMLQLLVERRDTLDVGEIIPVGDLYDVISRGTEAITPAFHQAFDRARCLYDQKLLPLLEREHDVSRSEVTELPWDDEVGTKWRADDRILKTLLISTLVSSVEPLRQLTAERIVLLNHGSIATRIPGQEARVVLNRLRTWAAEVPEIRLSGDSLNPQVTLELHGVDTEGIVRNAASHDNFGNRVALLRELVFAELEIAEGQIGPHADFQWRGTDRRCDVVFRNVADLPNSLLENDGPDWKIIVDFPIDQDGKGADDDQRKIQEFLQRGTPARTLVWAPRFLNDRARGELGKLVCLERILKSDQTFEQSAQHLSAADRVQARSLLSGQRDTLRDRVKDYLRGAYGLSNEPTSIKGLDEAVTVAETFVSLDPAFTPKPPAVGSLRAGLESLLRQALEYQYPHAPEWERHFKRGQYRKFLGFVRKAAASQPHRVPLDTADAKLMREFAEPLQLGECKSAFVLGDYWAKHFNRCLAQSGETVATVSQMRQWTDEPKARGLSRDVMDLLTIAYADQTERAFYRHGAILDDVDIGGLQGDDELRQIPMPSERDWKVACERAGAIFGESADMYLSGANAAALAKHIKGHIHDGRLAAKELREWLRKCIDETRQPSAPRLRDAEGVVDLFDRLDVDTPNELIERLAHAPIEAPVTPTSLGASWRQASKVVDAMKGANWQLLEGLHDKRDDPRVGPSATDLVDELAEALAAQQYVTPLEPVLRQVESKATNLLVSLPSPSPSPSVPDDTGGAMTVHEAAELDALATKLREELDAGRTVDVSWRTRDGEKR